MPDTKDTWSLDDLYTGDRTPAWIADKKEVEDTLCHINRALVPPDTKEAASILKSYEKVLLSLHRMAAYAYLRRATNLENPEVGAFFQETMEWITAVQIQTIPLERTFSQLKRRDAEALSEAFPTYASWIRQVRKMRPHLLPAKEEALMTERGLTAEAWVRLFDQTMDGVRGRVDGKSMTLTEMLDLLMDSDLGRRHRAGKALARALRSHEKTVVLIYNTLLKDHEIEDRWRRFPRPDSRQNLANDLPDRTVDVMLETVRAHMPKISHRYYAVKARLLGKKRLSYWDRLAPVSSSLEQVTYSFSEAKEIVLSAYASFDPELAAIGERFCTNRWIDVYPRPGKQSGAFAHPTSCNVHPYLLLNYMGRPRDVMVFAHELGHGIHQYLARRQGPLASTPPLPLSETASVFGENLTFSYLLKKIHDPHARLRLMAERLEDMLATLVRQVGFMLFEKEAHALRREKGELSPEHLSAIWHKFGRETLGPAVSLDRDFGVLWTYVAHFFHMPFYVYSYALAQCVVSSIWALYRETSVPNFQEKYRALLGEGGVRGYRGLEEIFGLYPSRRSFYERALHTLQTEVEDFVILAEEILG